jgi:hypothetical protein
MWAKLDPERATRRRIADPRWQITNPDVARVWHKGPAPARPTVALTDPGGAGAWHRVGGSGSAGERESEHDERRGGGSSVHPLEQRGALLLDMGDLVCWSRQGRRG